MALSTVPASTADPSRVHLDSGDLCALVCAASAGVHGALVLPHAREEASLGVAFALTTIALAIAALGLALRPSPGTSAAAGALLIAVATAYLLTRTTGIPGLTDHPERFDPLGVAVSLIEVAGAVLVVRQLDPRRP